MTDFSSHRGKLLVSIIIGLIAIISLAAMLSPGIIGITGENTSGDVEDTSITTTSAIVSENNISPTHTSEHIFTATAISTPSQSPTPTRFSTSIPSQTSTPFPTSTPSPVPSPTSSPTSTPNSSPYDNEKYDEFVGAVFGETEVDAATPIRIRAWTVAEGNSLIVILNLTAETEDDLKRAKAVNTLVTSGYAQAVAHHDTGKIGGKITDRLRIAEINNTGAPPKTLYINTSLAREYYTGQINAVEFTEEYWETERNMTSEEIDFVNWLDNGTEDVILHNQTAG
ncbi:hypothetical protein [Halosimplex marinum]|uniref:hypothetical protein n=1 Tax=Halosimplex marinum TaxID=3396620 RepID=UPI003F5580EC